MKVKIQSFSENSQFSIILAAISLITYYLFIFLAIMYYPGGYDFWEYYYSDLGRVIALNGERNNLSLIFFILAMLLSGTLFFPFWRHYYKIFLPYPKAKYFAFFGTGFGIMTNPLAIGIGLFPLDTALVMHVIISQGYYLFLAIAVLSFSIAILYSKYSNVNAILGTGLVIIIIAAVLGLFGEFQPLSQKIISFGIGFWLLLQIQLTWTFFQEKYTL